MDRIQSRFNALNSSLILGTFWAFWHLPLWFMPGTSMGFTPFGPFLIALLGLSVILTWIYNNTRKSLVAAVLTHGMFNSAHSLFPVFNAPGAGQRVYLYWAVICAFVAAVISAIWGPAALTGKKGG